MNLDTVPVTKGLCSNTSEFVCWVCVACRSFMSCYAKSKLAVCIIYLNRAASVSEEHDPCCTWRSSSNRREFHVFGFSMNVHPASEGFGTLITVVNSILSVINASINTHCNIHNHYQVEENELVNCKDLPVGPAFLVDDSTPNDSSWFILMLCLTLQEAFIPKCDQVNARYF